MLRSMIISCVAFIVIGCSSTTTIYNTAPFYTEGVAVSDENVERAIQATESFARQRGFEVEVNRFSRYSFSALIKNNNMNITVLRTRQGDTLEIGAISRSTSTPAQRDIVNSYVELMRGLR